jgi:hypothetical protein
MGKLAVSKEAKERLTTSKTAVVKASDVKTTKLNVSDATKSKLTSSKSTVTYNNIDYYDGSNGKLNTKEVVKQRIPGVDTKLLQQSLESLKKDILKTTANVIKSSDMEEIASISGSAIADTKKLLADVTKAIEIPETTTTKIDTIDENKLKQTIKDIETIKTIIGTVEDDVKLLESTAINKLVPETNRASALVLLGPDISKITIPISEIKKNDVLMSAISTKKIDISNVESVPIQAVLTEYLGEASKGKKIATEQQKESTYAYEYTSAQTGGKKTVILNNEEKKAIDELVNAEKLGKESFQAINYDTDKSQKALVSLTNVAGYAMSNTDSATKVAKILNDDVAHNADIKVFGQTKEGYGTTLLDLEHHITSEDQLGVVYRKLEAGEVINAKTGEIEKREIEIKKTDKGIEVKSSEYEQPFKIEDGVITIYGKEYTGPVSKPDEYDTVSWTKWVQDAETTAPDPIKGVLSLINTMFSNGDTRLENAGYVNKKIVENEGEHKWSMFDGLTLVSRQLQAVTGSLLMGSEEEPLMDIDMAWKGIEVNEVTDEGKKKANIIADEWISTGKVDNSIKNTGLTTYDAQRLVLQGADVKKLEDLAAKRPKDLGKLSYDPFSNAFVVDAYGTERVEQFEGTLTRLEKEDVIASVAAGGINELVVNQEITGTPLDVIIAVATAGIGGKLVSTGGKIAGKIDDIVGGAKDLKTFMKEARIEVPSGTGEIIDLTKLVKVSDVSMVNTGNVGTIAKKVDPTIKVTEVRKLDLTLDAVDTPLDAKKFVDNVKTLDKEGQKATMVELSFTQPKKLTDTVEKATSIISDKKTFDETRTLLKDANAEKLKISTETVNDLVKKANGEPKKLAELIVKESDVTGSIGSRTAMDELLKTAIGEGTEHYNTIINAIEEIKKIDFKDAVDIPTGKPFGATKAISREETLDLRTLLGNKGAERIARYGTDENVRNVDDIVDLAEMTREDMKWIASNMGKSELDTTRLEKLEAIKQKATDFLSDMNYARTTTIELSRSIDELGKTMADEFNTVMKKDDIGDMEVKTLVRSDTTERWIEDAKKIGLNELNDGSWTWDANAINRLSTNEFKRIMGEYTKIADDVTIEELEEAIKIFDVRKVTDDRLLEIKKATDSELIGTILRNVSRDEILNAPIAEWKKKALLSKFIEYSTGIENARAIAKTGIVEVNKAATNAIKKLADGDIENAAVELAKGSVKKNRVVSIAETAYKDVSIQAISRMKAFGAPSDLVESMMKGRSDFAINELARTGKEGKTLAYKIKMNEIDGTDRLLIWDKYRSLGRDALHHKDGNQLIAGLVDDAIEAGEKGNTELTTRLMKELGEELELCIKRKECV